MYYFYNMILNSSERRIGETLVDLGFMEEKNVRIVLLRQEFGDQRLFGEIATSLNYLAERDLHKALPVIE